MHTCETYKTWISALIDDEISEAERVALMEHLSQCADCKAYLDDQLVIHEAVQSLDCTAPAGLTDAVMARVRETAQDRPEKKIVSFPHWKQFAGIAACCAVIALGIFVSNEGMLTMENSTSSDCAAPQMAYSVNTAAETAGTEETYGAAVTEGARETPAAPGSGADNGAYAANDGQTYSQSGDFIQFAMRLTTGSDIAAQWVSETLGQEWISGTHYLLTEEEYVELRSLLTAEGEAFDETTGVEGSALYQLWAE